MGVGIFGLVASPSDVTSLMQRLEGTVPDEVITLVQDSLTRVTQSGGGSLTAVVVGFVLALWTLSGAMNALMRAVNSAYGRRETRGYVRRRITGLIMIACFAVAGALVVGLPRSRAGRLGRSRRQRRSPERHRVDLVDAEWPILLAALLSIFAAIYVLAPDVEHARFNVLAPGTVLAVVLWLGASAGFSLYVARFSSYNKTWGSLAGVIVLVTWLWLSALSVLLGAEVNSEAERSRELRAGLPAEIHLVAPTSSGAAVAGAAPVRARDDRAHAEGDARLGAGALVLTGILAIALWLLRAPRGRD